MIPAYTDTSPEAVRAHIEQQLDRGDIVTLTRGQIRALLAEREVPQPNQVRA